MKVNQILFIVLIIVSINPLKSQSLKLDGEPELFAPGIISTEKSEIKITFSDNGNIILWGVTNWDGGYGGWDIELCNFYRPNRYYLYILHITY